MFNYHSFYFSYMGKITTNLKDINGVVGIREGDILEVRMPDADHISFGVYQKGFPILIGFERDTVASVLVKRKHKEIRGECLLKVRAYDKRHRGFGQQIKFAIV